MADDEKLLSASEVAKEFQVTDQTIRNWIKSGALKAIKIGRDHRIRREDVDELLSRAQAESASLATRRTFGSRRRWGSLTVAATRTSRRRFGMTEARYRFPPSVPDIKLGTPKPSAVRAALHTAGGTVRCD